MISVHVLRPIDLSVLVSILHHPVEDCFCKHLVPWLGWSVDIDMVAFGGHKSLQKTTKNPRVDLFEFYCRSSHLSPNCTVACCSTLSSSAYSDDTYPSSSLLESFSSSCGGDLYDFQSTCLCCNHSSRPHQKQHIKKLSQLIEEDA
jgi:hypothetical protein